MFLPSIYESERRLHDGAASEVYRGRRRADGRPVVLKVFKAAHPSPEQISRFRHEYEIPSALDAAGVVEAYAFETDQKRWAIVLEDFGGESLDSAIGDASLELEDLLVLAIEVVKALGQLHEARIIHKDINPSNIVWNRQTGQLKLVDFGIATVLPRESPALRSPSVLEGTLAYISPEQTGRMSSAVDYRADFYSLGVTLYELLTGRRPFETSEPLELVHCHIARQPRPPREVTPRIPAALSDVVMKLLEKTPEARYQSSYGIQRDLERCLEELRARGEIGEFRLGRHDVSQRLSIPQRLYGRDAESQALLQAFSETHAGPDGEDRATATSRLVLVTGPAGIGKSALVERLHWPVTARRGYFFAGKFEQLQRSVPYSAVVQAFRSLVQEILSESEEQLDRWRGSLAEALGTNGQVIIDVIPQLELIIGPQPPVQELGPVEAGNRFDRVLRRFIRVFARPAHPLVIFLDDLQWSDWATLQLMKLMLTDSEAAGLLVVGAYRDSEVGPSHLLSGAISELREAGASIQEIRLAPLALEHVAEIVADTVGATSEEVAPLARSIAKSTEGNPLFVTEFLRTLYDEGLLAFDRPTGCWRWDIAEIEAHGFTENVLDLMVAKLARLPDDAQATLRLAACVGSRFDLSTLSALQGLEPEEALGSLMPAIEAGVVSSGSELEMIAAGDSAAAAGCRFFHDRVQQAAYATLDEAQRTATHLRIGRLMLASTPTERRPHELFGIVDQLNRGSELITDDDERVELAALNLEAGRKAQASTAYVAAVTHLRRGLDLLPAERWQRYYELTRDLHIELAIAENLVGEHERSEALTKAVLEHARTELEKARVENIVVRHYTMAARYDEAIDGVRRGLALLGIELPTGDLREAVQSEFETAQAGLGSTPVAELLDRPTMTDSVIRAATRLLISGFAVAFYLDPVLYGLLILKSVTLSLRHGHPPDSTDLYSYYGHLLSSLFGKPQEGYEFGQLAVRLSDKAGRLQDKCRSSFILANFIHAWVAPLARARAVNNDGFEAGLESGELQFAGYIAFYKGLHDFYSGKPMAALSTEVDEYLSFNESVSNTASRDTTRGLALALANLGGKTSGPGEFETETIDEAGFIADCQANQSSAALCYYQILKTQALGLHGMHAEALEASAAAKALTDSILGNIAVAEHAFHTALSLAALWAEAGASQREALWPKLEGHAGKLEAWAARCPENFSHMAALVTAEMASCKDATAEAIDAYELAIDRAEANGWPQHLALANELAARFWLRRGREGVGRDHLAEAHYGYRLWGAGHKTAALEAEFPWLAAEPRAEAAALGAGATVVTSSGELDLASVIKASQAISGEIVLERLLRQLMRLVLENAGAQRGVLVVDSEGELLVQATASLGPSAEEGSPEITVRQAVPLASYAEIAHPVVDYVARTGESLILNDALGEGHFTAEPYIQAARPKSVLCTPLIHQGQAMGFLYLENGLITGAFTDERLEVLHLLSSQFVLSFENASLYEEMEQKVEKRTEQLSQKNQELERTLADLRTTQDRLVHSEKMASLGQLTAGVAHEINNPLNFVTNFAEVGGQLIDELREAREGNPELRLGEVEETISDLAQNLETIGKHGKRATGIVQSMLQHARGATGERELVDLNAFVGQTVNLAKFAARDPQDESRVTVELDLDEAAGRVEIMPQEFGQVLVNLLNNALDATQDRGRRESGPYQGRVTISTRRCDDRIEVRVRDNGSGIPEEIRDQIFQPFFTTKSGTQGTGLGLSLSYDIVVQGHGGQLTVESEPGAGTTFVVNLPSDGGSTP